MRNRPALALVLALALASTGTLPASAATPVEGGTARGVSLRPVPDTGCNVFPRNNVWNTRVDRLPVHEMSEVWLRSADAETTLLHPDFGPPDYGLPFEAVGRGHAMVSIDLYYADESDPGPYPLDARTPIEGGSDRHALMVQRGTCRLFELFDADWNGGDPTAGSGAIWDLDSNRLRPDTWTSADAAGLPILPGLVRFDEVAAGRIAHAIRFTLSCTKDEHVWPARHDAGVDEPDCPPMGARFRLKAEFDLSGFSRRAQTILRGMQRYGLILADNGSDWFFQGTRDGRWRIRLLDQLKTVPASAFEAVDASACMVRPNSGRADCPDA